MIEPIKQSVVAIIGRERVNQLTAPVYDWMARRRTRHLLARLPDHGLLVHLGCGQRQLTGWVNVDADRGGPDRVVWDLRVGFPFPEKSCSAIFSEHLIEHIDRPQALSLLRQCRTALESNGVARFSTPDAGLYLRSYAGADGFLERVMSKRPAQTAMDCVNRMMREDGLHYWVYDAESLTLLFREAGFSTVKVSEYGISMHDAMQDIDSEQRRYESLYVEARP